jgi:NADH-quinone oxidoreductase subunit L
MAGALIGIPLLPLLGSALLLLAGKRLGERGSAAVGVGSVLLAALLTAWVIAGFVAGGEPYTVTLGQWFSVAGLTVTPGLHFDGLAAVMTGVITGVGLLIHWYSAAYMAGEEGYSRYFGYLNLFVAAMLVLVLADNFLLLYLGWEGVGLCSYLLIGFWYREPANGYAARKAFVVTRVGDVALAVALFMLVGQFGTLHIETVVDRAWQQTPGTHWLALLLLIGAVGKSAQLPLQTWLPDAMAGPTPVSALIHAATMVTAGVYLIARSHELFLMAPPVMDLVALVGGLTLFLAACSALVQTDLKRILAYSTISQIGYMFFALGTGAFSAAVFHLMTHAFFKALLFLAAGQVILSLHHEQDIRRMGGLARPMPFSLACFAIGGAALAALPLTAGFYSKDAILMNGYALAGGTPAWFLALAGALVTALYSARMVLRVFFGEAVTRPDPDRRPALVVPLAVLSVLSLAGALIPRPLGDFFADLGRGGVPETVHIAVLAMPWLGLAMGLGFWRYGGAVRDRWQDSALAAWWRRGWGFDTAYQWLLIRPFIGLARANRDDIADGLTAAVTASGRAANAGLSALQNGRIRWYAAFIAAGAILTIALVGR